MFIGKGNFQPFAFVLRGRGGGTVFGAVCVFTFLALYNRTSKKKDIFINL